MKDKLLRLLRDRLVWFVAFGLVLFAFDWLAARRGAQIIRIDLPLVEKLVAQWEGQGNPFKFGLISASDTHVSAGGFDEFDYWSKIGMVDATGRLRGSVELTWSQRLMAQYARIRNWWAQRQTLPAARTGLPGKNPAPGFLHMQWSSWGASGLAGVWAEENTRDSIFAAMRRK